MPNDQLDRLFDYTKFHIGFYATVITGLFAVIGFAVSNSQQQVLSRLLPFAVATAILVLIAGAAGGAIASNIPDYRDFTSFAQDNLNVFGLETMRYKTWAHIEHVAFWLAVAVATIGFLSLPCTVKGVEADQKPVPSVVSQSTSGTVQVTSNPDGADVYSDDRRQRPQHAEASPRQTHRERKVHRTQRLVPRHHCAVRVRSEVERGAGEAVRISGRAFWKGTA